MSPARGCCSQAANAPTADGDVPRTNDVGTDVLSQRGRSYLKGTTFGCAVCVQRTSVKKGDLQRLMLAL